MEAILDYLRRYHPEATVDAMCTGPTTVTGRYEIDATNLFWSHQYPNVRSPLLVTPLKVAGRLLDVYRTAVWTARHDAVIVPGAGVLEASLPISPRGFPCALFLLSLSGKVFRTKVALVSIGAGQVKQPLARWFMNATARLAFYRSYRDAGARVAMEQRGIDTERDPVYPDLAFALKAPPHDPGEPDVVAVGVMDYRGTADDRRRADEIYDCYVDAMRELVLWLVDNGRKVRLIVGDTNGSDDRVVDDIISYVRAHRPQLDESQLIAEDASTFGQVMEALLPVRIVIAIRYHNILCALRLSKPTISISYSPKHDVLMEDMGLGGFCQPVEDIHVTTLVDQLKELESHAAQLERSMLRRNDSKMRLLDRQFAELSSVLLPADGPPGDAR
jgi:polysaccharide pyruvyl transferase WcaK-like protein